MTTYDVSNVKQQMIAVNDVELNVATAGPENGKLVILLHGFPEFWYGWRKQINFLADLGYRVWAPDMRGYNLSSKPRGMEHYTGDKLAGDVAGLIAAAGQERAFIIGHDWGAIVAWTTAIMHPEKVEKLGIMNVPHPGVFVEHIGSSPEQTLRSWYMYLFQIPLVAELVLTAGDCWFAGAMMVQSSRSGTFTDADMARYTEAWLRPGAMTSMLNYYRTIFQLPIPYELDTRITAPTLLIWGVKDIALGRELAQPSIDMCDDGRLVFIEEASHWVQHEEPDRVNALLRDFLADTSA